MAKSGRGPLRIAIEDWFDTFTLGKIISKWFGEFGEDEEAKIAEVNADLYKILSETEGVPDVLQGLARGDTSGTYQGGAATALSFAVGVGQQAAGGLLGPISRKLGQAVDSKLRSMIPDIGSLIAMNRRGAILSKTYNETAAKAGWPQEFITAWEQLTTPLLGVGDLLALWRRNEIAWGDVITELDKQGWESEKINQLQKLSEIIPGVGDLINMAVREAFNDQVAGAFGYDEAFPSQILEYTKAHGLSEEWVRRSWRAHWVLPSVGQGFEMYHRLRSEVSSHPLGDDELDLLLRSLDIPTFWRERLKEIAYAPLTRVDVRRMYGAGVLSRDEVKANYLDLGYNEENAERMAEFTVLYEEDETKELSRTAIIQGYKRGVLTQSEAIAGVQRAGYNAQNAAFFIALADWETERDQIDAETDLVQALYIDGAITKSEAVNQLTGLNLPTAQIETLITDWELDRRKKIRLPTEGELEDFYLTDIITAAEYESGLLARRYHTDSLDWFLVRADMKRAEQAEKTEAAALAKEEQLRKSEITGSYRLGQAQLDVQIAEARSNIAGLKVLAHEVEDEDTQNEIADMLVQLAKSIADLKLEKALLHLEVETVL